MAFVQKDNTGTLFRNDRKENDNHPNAKGTALIDGVEYEVAAWTKQGNKGPFQSLSFKRKDAPRQERRKDDVKPLTRQDEEEFGDVPF